MKNTPLNLDSHDYSHFEEFADCISRKSDLVWEEHCTECAYPVCYSSCSFYTPGADFNCLRLDNGIEIHTHGSLRLRRVKFRKWGKLEAAGPAKLITAKLVSKNSHSHDLLKKILTILPLSFRVKRSFLRRLHSRTLAKSQGEYQIGDIHFVIEAWLHSGPSIPFTFSIAPKNKEVLALYQNGFELLEGYNRVSFPVSDIEKVINLTEPHLVQLEPVTEAPEQNIIFGVLNFVEYESLNKQNKINTAISPEKPPLVKCVVWDLDNTLWDGILAEDGIEGVNLRIHTMETIQELDRRGILQSVASKNDSQLGLKALKIFGLNEYMLYPQISWEPKSNAIANIVKLLDIGADALIFVDDQPFERGEVSAMFPMIECFSDAETSDLINMPRLQLPVTTVSTKRRQMYKDEEKRNTLLEGSNSSYMAFLRSCNIVLTISNLTLDTLERAFELSQRTNQLNFSGTRYSRNELKQFIGNTNNQVALVLSCEDRFGDYGMIGLCILDFNLAQIESFMMSCRVQRKYVEHSFFSYIATEFKNLGIDEFRVKYVQTERNQASRTLLKNIGFESSTAEEDAGVTFSKQTAETLIDADIVTLISNTSIDSSND